VLGLRVRVAILLSFKKERKVRGSNSPRGMAGNQFHFLLSWFSWGSRSRGWWHLESRMSRMGGAMEGESSLSGGEVLEGCLEVGSSWW